MGLANIVYIYGQSKSQYNQFAAAEDPTLFPLFVLASRTNAPKRSCNSAQHVQYL